MARAKKTVRQLAAEAGVSDKAAIASLKSAGIVVAHPQDSVPRSRSAVARAAMGLLRQTPDVRSVAYLAARAGMPEEEARRHLVNAGVLDSWGNRHKSRAFQKLKTGPVAIG